MSDFIQLNQFTKNTDGVFHAAGADLDFAYSDGENIKATLYQILRDAKDLSSASAELQAQIVDWPTEYHLSQTRANLLRPLNLSGVTRVLELGCGCGSISRYLGEIDGIQVDSVEGSAKRAALAALRCRDLENVRVSVANFNDVEIPSDYYDLVLFVGVTEYAGRFSERATDQQALQDLLALARKATTLDGVTLIAIENRLGLKYMLGANEDHYGLRFVGLDNYIDSSGIRTYSRAEWEQQITAAGFRASKFVYPFPDYKVPTVLVSDEADPQAVINALEGLKSRDYVEPFDLGESEHRIWQGLLESSNFADHANSFLILLADDAKILPQICDFDLVKYQEPELNYELIGDSERVDDKRVQAQQSRIERLQTHAQGLEKKIDLMSNSLGWRAINVVRRFLGKKTL